MVENIHISKEEFLEKHNKLSPPKLKASFAMLTRFQEEKNPSLKDNGWSMHKLRAPFITWLMALSRKENNDKNNQPKNKNQAKPKIKGYRNYPETKFKS